MLIDFLAPPRVLFGPGSCYRLGEEARRLGTRALVITGLRSLLVSGNLDRITNPLKQADIDTIFYNEVGPEPTIEKVDQVRSLAREQACEMIIGVGGGSVLDVAKAAAGLFYEESRTKDFYDGRSITTQPLPWIAVPTTAGSGSEATTNAVLVDPQTGKKCSLRHELWTAQVAIVDPIFSMSMPKKLTALTGIDALTHAIEAYTSRWTNPYSEAISEKAALLIMRNIYTAYNLGRSREAREKMMLGSFLAGSAIAQVRCGAVHALSHSVGVRYGLPHGLVCGVLLPYVMEFNLPRTLDKYARLAHLAGIAAPSLSEEEAANRLIHYVYRLRAKLGFPNKLNELGLQREHLSELVEAALPSSSLEANPRMAKREDLQDILEKNL
ncbi:MAG: iron-containing alcohol dehydrogenase family protein [Bacillota bacterium]